MMTDETEKKEEDNGPEASVSNDFTAGHDVDPQAEASVGADASAETTVGGVDLEAHAGAEASASAGTEVTDTSAAASAEASVGAEAGASATVGAVSYTHLRAHET